MFPGSGDRKQKRISYSLSVTAGDGTAYLIPVGEAALTVGRSPATAIRVSEEGVSRQHCVITPSGGRLMLLDQGSTNGTFVNGARVQQARLGHGDVVQVGSTRIRIEARSDFRESLGSTPTRPAPALAPSAAVTPRWSFGLVGRLAGRLARSVGAASAADLVLDAVFEAFPVDRAYILTVRPGRGDLAVDVLASKARDSGADAAGELDPAIPERVVRALQSNPSLYGAAEASAAVAAAIRDRCSSPILAVPLRQGNRIKGTLYLDALTMPEWGRSEDMLALLTAIGNLASLALGRARPRTETRGDSQPGMTRPSQTDPDNVALQGSVERSTTVEEQHLELAARLEEVHHLRASQTIMTRGLVHDVRSMVGAIQSNLEFAGRSILADAAEAAALRDAALCSQNLIQLAEDVASLIRLEEGTFSLRTEPVDVASVIDEVMGTWKERADDRGLTLISRVLTSPLVVVVDRGLLGRVLDHLIDNSFRHSAKGGHVLITARYTASSVDIIVADSGPGVPPLERPLVFSDHDIFSTGTRHHGVGLYFCRLAMEAHGGSIRVEGPDGNNRFVLALPGALHVSRGGPATKEDDVFVTPIPRRDSAQPDGSDGEPGPE